MYRRMYIYIYIYVCVRALHVDEPLGQHSDIADVLYWNGVVCVLCCMCVCVCIYVCVYMYRHTHICVCIYVYVYMYRHTYNNAYVYINVCVRALHVDEPLGKHPDISDVLYWKGIVRVLCCMCVYIYVCVYKYTHTYINVYLYIHVCVRAHVDEPLGQHSDSEDVLYWKVVARVL